MNIDRDGIVDSFEIPGLGTLTAICDHQTIDRARGIHKGLLKSRRIPDPASLNTLSGEVFNLLLRGYGQGDFEKEEEQAQAALEFIQGDLAEQIDVLYEHAVRVSLFYSNFSQVGNSVNFKDFRVVLLPQDFDDSASNVQREDQLLPPLHKRMTSYPDEQRVALLEKLFREHVDFYTWFKGYFGRVIGVLTIEVQQEVNALYQGKTKSGVAGNSSPRSDAAHSKRKRGTGGTVYSLQGTDAGDVQQSPVNAKTQKRVIRKDKR